MSNPGTTQLPGYITSAKPSPLVNRAPWYKNTAPTYAGIFLWFVFWQGATTTQQGFLGGTLAHGVGVALLGLVISGLVCHAMFYFVPGMLGMKTGLPLYIVGTSTFGAKGGFFMPGFLMGVLQFGWLGVNIYFASAALGMMIYPGINPLDPSTIPVAVKAVMVFWGLLAAFVGLKGIQYVAKVATFLPLIPLAVLLWMFIKTQAGIPSFQTAQFIAGHQALAEKSPGVLSEWSVMTAVLTYVVGFFATAGAAGVDFGTNSRDKKDVSMGGLVGVAYAIIITAGLSMFIVAGVYGTPELREAALKAGAAKKEFLLDSFNLIPVVLGENTGKWVMFLLAVAAFPPACFSSFIAANSFKTTMPKVNPFVSVGIGAVVSIALAVTGAAGKVIPVFVIIGASFGPICGAMMADYVLSGGKWTGPRAGFNPAGWIAWLLGFIVGILPNIGVDVPAAPVLAFVVGAVAYFVCAKIDLQNDVIPWVYERGHVVEREKKLVLIIEDEIDMANLYELHLQGAGYDTMIATDGMTGLEHAIKHTPDLVLLDMELPKMHGLEVCRRLRATPATRHIPTLVVSSLSSTDMKVQGLHTGADDYLTKPFKPAELLARVEALLRRYTNLLYVESMDRPELDTMNM
ncbi:MAG: response regulator [Verrucomicrobia bacterium]|nr:response regulator [Verrucomicrobiota bacterium]